MVTLLTVPEAPPAAGPDRALDPPPAAAAEDDVAVVEGDVAVAEGDEPQAARKTLAAHAAVAAKIHRGRDRVVLVSGGLAGFESFMITFLSAQEAVQKVWAPFLRGRCAPPVTLPNLPFVTRQVVAVTSE